MSRKISRKDIGSAVFRFNNGKSLETFKRDEDFESWTISDIVLGKVRISHDRLIDTDGRKVYEYVDMSRLTHIDRDTYILDMQTKTPETDIVPIQDIAAKVNEEVKSTSKPRTPRQRTNAAQQA